MDNLLVKRLSNNVCHIILNRPNKLNALNEELLSELLELLNKVESSNDYKALIISGAGDSFAAGADLKEIGNKSVAQFEEYVRLIQEVTWKIEKLPLLTIAALKGLAFGGGLEIALACDFRLASPETRFALPEVKLGLIPGGGGTYRLPKLIGLAKAKKLLYTGSAINSEKALQLGVIEEIIEGDLLEGVISFCRKITRHSTVAFRAIKESASHAFEVDTYAARQMEVQTIVSTFNSEECEQGIKAFLQK